MAQRFNIPANHSIQRRRTALHWLLLVSLLLQSIGPTALASVSAISTIDDEMGEGGEVGTEGNADTNGADGIWTISCVGKPMWLPFPVNTGYSNTASSQTSIVSQATENGADHNLRHCLICNTSACSDTLSAPADYVDFRWQHAVPAYPATAAVPVPRQLAMPYQPRAPPAPLH